MQYISPLVVDDNGDTPLHICARLSRWACVEALLELNPPIMIRNNLGQLPRDVSVAHDRIDQYVQQNKHKSVLSLRGHLEAC